MRQKSDACLMLSGLRMYKLLPVISMLAYADSQSFCSARSSNPAHMAAHSASTSSNACATEFVNHLPSHLLQLRVDKSGSLPS